MGKARAPDQAVWLMLTAQQHANRDGKITGSRGPAILMAGTPEQLLDLWKELIGDPSYVAPDFSRNWAVRVGERLEGLILDWITDEYGPVSRRQEWVSGPEEWMGCHLDGWLDNYNCPVEAKATGGREPLETVRARYLPQCVWQATMCGVTRCALTIAPNNPPITEIIDVDLSYANELMARARAFWRCVETLTPPVALPSVEPPAKPIRTVDMTGHNLWGSYAAQWVANKQAAVLAKDAEKSLKEMVLPDVMRCFGNGVEVKRDRAGRLSVRELL